MLPDWAGGRAQPLCLADADYTIDQVSRVLVLLAKRQMPPRSEHQLVAVEFSRWLGVAASQLLAVGPHPKPELLPVDTEPAPLVHFMALTAKQQINGLLAVLSALASDGGWGNRNLAFTARQLREDLLWWKRWSNLWAVLE